jgi:hypothetical protein
MCDAHTAKDILVLTIVAGVFIQFLRPVAAQSVPYSQLATAATPLLSGITGQHHRARNRKVGV